MPIDYSKWDKLELSDDEDSDNAEAAPSPSAPPPPRSNFRPKHKPAASTDGGRVAIASTVKDVSERIESWIKWHLHVGFERLYLFFDDPDESDSMAIAERAGGNAVEIIRRDEALRRRWAEQPSWHSHRDVADDNIQVRQSLNVQHAMDLCRKGGMTWLLHIDSDELFLPDASEMAGPDSADEVKGAAGRLFDSLAASGAEAFAFANHEVVPEHVAEIDTTRDYGSSARGDPFATLSLFKLSYSPAFVARTAETEAIADEWRCRQPGREFEEGLYFLYYEHGKSAVRVDTDGNYVPPTVHHFFPRRPGLLGGGWDKDRLKRRGLTNDARNASLYTHRPDVKASVLHYAMWDPRALWAKYRLHGDFSDEISGVAVRDRNGGAGSFRWGDLFHARCRDVYLAARDDPDAGRGAMRDLFREAAAVEDEGEAERQVRAGMLRRFGVVREVLRREGVAAAGG